MTRWENLRHQDNADKYAARFFAHYRAVASIPEPTDEAMAAAFEDCGLVPPPFTYPTIRQAIHAMRPEVEAWRITHP